MKRNYVNNYVYNCFERVHDAWIIVVHKKEIGSALMWRKIEMLTYILNSRFPTCY